jgi:two-component system, response regulator YesN
MLIDDDVPMLKYLEKLVQSYDLEMKICGLAYSSLKALHLFRSTLPDIVVTDIGLPQMNGLSLVEKFKEIKPEVRMIFLTCHEDFRYAKRAVELQADEYLIKDELTPEQFEKSLRKSLQKIKSSPHHLELYSFRQTIQNNKDVLKQNFLEQVLIGRNIENMKGYGEKLGINWNFSDFIVGISFIDLNNLPEQTTLQDIPVIKYGILNIAEELAQNIKGMIPLPDKENNLYIILNFKHTISRNIFEEYNHYLDVLQKKVKEYLQINISLLYSVDIVRRMDLGIKLLKLRESRYQYFYQNGSIHPIHMNLQNKWNFNSNELLNSFGSTLIKAFENKNLPKIIKTINELEVLSREKHINPVQLLENGERWVKSIELRGGNSIKNENFFYFLRHSVKLQEVIFLLRKKLTQLINSSGETHYNLGKKPKLQEIDQYIMEHLSDNISSADIARFLFLNPSYFSRYLKKLAGENLLIISIVLK